MISCTSRDKVYRWKVLMPVFPSRYTPMVQLMPAVFLVAVLVAVLVAALAVGT